MTKIYGNVEILEKSNKAVVTLKDELGHWMGSYAVWDRPKAYDSTSVAARLYERAYDRADQMATLKGGRLERFQVGSN